VFLLTVSTIPFDPCICSTSAKDGLSVFQNAQGSVAFMLLYTELPVAYASLRKLFRD
jgi:hypothetical protein